MDAIKTKAQEYMNNNDEASAACVSFKLTKYIIHDINKLYKEL